MGVNASKSYQAYLDAYAEHARRMAANYRERMELYDLMWKSPGFAEVEVQRSLADITRFFKYHMWTHEPRPGVLALYGVKRPTLPFLLFPFQEKAIAELSECLYTGQDVLVEKSRDMGVSWLVLSVFFFHWLQPTGGNDFLFGSRKFDFVDKRGAQDTLFEKIRYNLYRLHPAFLPGGFSIDRNDNVGMITNPFTGSFMRAEANNANFGTSGRYKSILLDEFAKWLETDADAWTSCGDSSPCRVPVSTPWGIGRKFADLALGGNIRKIRLHWSKHPIKGAGKWKGMHPVQKEKKNVWLSWWYLNEVERRKDDPGREIGQELDIDYLSSGTPYFNNMVIQKRWEDLQQHPVKVKRYGFELLARNQDGRRPLKLFEDSTGGIRIVTMPANEKWKYRYVIGADVAEGLEVGDFDYAPVIDRVTGKDVAWYHGKANTDTYAYILAHLAILYQDAWIAVEKNNEHGGALLAFIKGFYYNLYHEQEFEGPIDLERKPVRLGWATNTKTRGILCSTLRTAIHEGSDGILDSGVFQEALSFIYNKNGKPEAAEGKHDDRIFGRGIAIQAASWLPEPERIVELPADVAYTSDYGERKKKTKNWRDEFERNADFI